MPGRCGQAELPVFCRVFFLAGHLGAAIVSASLQQIARLFDRVPPGRACGGCSQHPITSRPVPPGGGAMSEEERYVRSLVVVEYVSLDGVIQAPGHSGEDRDGGFAHGGWTGGFMADHQRHNSQLFPAAGAFLLGRRTYEIFASYWPTVTDERDRSRRHSTAGPSTWCPRRCARLPGPERPSSPVMSRYWSPS